MTRRYTPAGRPLHLGFFLWGAAKVHQQYLAQFWHKKQVERPRFLAYSVS